MMNASPVKTLKSLRKLTPFGMERNTGPDDKYTFKYREKNNR